MHCIVGVMSLSFFRRAKFLPERLYLDYAAATPMRSEVLWVMQPYFNQIYGNAGAIHAEGRAAREAITNSRMTIARTLGVRPLEITFTGSGSEANNLALCGHVRALVEDKKVPFSEIEIISTKIEHPSILAVLDHLEELGVTITYVPVNDVGLIDLTALENLLSPRVKLISFVYGNSEIGTVQPVKKITRLVKKYNQRLGATIAVHTDASQAPRWLSCYVPMLGVDAITLDAGKCEGPKGVGMLVAREALPLKGMVLGGGQERGLRAGTEHTAAIVGAAEALKLAQVEWPSANQQTGRGTLLLFQSLKECLPELVLNGPWPELKQHSKSHRITHNRLPNNLNISLPGINTEYAVTVLDKEGIAASTKSACSAGSLDSSSVVKTISGDDALAAATIRFSLGPNSNLNGRITDNVARILKNHIEHMSAA